jgi:hypothetical protein
MKKLLMLNLPRYANKTGVQMGSEKQKDERDDQTEPGYANKKKIEEQAAYVEQRLRELAIWERRVRRSNPLKRDP